MWLARVPPLPCRAEQTRRAGCAFQGPLAGALVFGLFKVYLAYATPPQLSKRDSTERHATRATHARQATRGMLCSAQLRAVCSAAGCGRLLPLASDDGIACEQLSVSVSR